MSEFDDIRPYNDNEVQPVLEKILADDEFVDLIGQLRFGRSYTVLAFLFRPVLRMLLRRNTREVKSVMDFQQIVANYLIKMIDTTMNGLTVEGMDKLDLTQPCLFMSNHRDITLDPALTNYALYNSSGETLRIAIGDNLLSKPFASDLMRLNKSFIVKRSISQPRKLLAALKKLSSYIEVSLHKEGQHIWIAHREGRAKNGWDETEAAIIKMLAIAKPRQVAFSEYINSLRIVPVAISYEYDPCDADKGRELRIISAGREYIKDEHEDLESIGKGISGFKGKVDLVVGQPLQGNYETPEQVADAMDEAIVGQYRLHASNVLAFIEKYGEHEWQRAEHRLSSREETIPSLDADSTQTFRQRMSAIPVKDREFVLDMYANPIMHKLERLGN